MFDRFNEECVKCACYVGNCSDEDARKMDSDCSLENETMGESSCRDYSECDPEDTDWDFEYGETPSSKGMKKRKIIRPEGGWKSRKHYIVEVAFNEANPVHRRILYTGFIDDNGDPCGYSGLLGGGVADPADINELFYLKPIKIIEGI